jgi:hypothetical protein
MGRGVEHAARRRAPPSGDDGSGEQEAPIELALVTVHQNKEMKRDGDSMGTTSKRARERQNRMTSTRRTRRCAHFGEGVMMATEGLAEVGEDDRVDVRFA